ncbi:MAG: acireductone synthase [Acidobacteria bacterium]|nr:acireductone synthase [Acidobacteriota bacterium]MBK8150234.1 acireductone synthase [Acidobacteriota bacterium]
MIKAVLLDIEGTATPIDFVHRTLFPYAKSKMEDFVVRNIAALENEIAELKAEYRKDFQDQVYGRKFNDREPETIVKYLEWLIDVDRKSTPLKAIEGQIWRAGYESGELVSRVFADVPEALKRWTERGVKVAVFSSGSVLAQRLIFTYSNAGDLSGLISGYFDTHIGKKQNPGSYYAIARELGYKPGEMLFVSDVVAELDAARDAGFLTLLSVREGNGKYPHPIQHDVIGSFSDID